MPGTNAIGRHKLDTALTKLFQAYTAINVDDIELYGAISPLTPAYMQNGISQLQVLAGGTEYQGGGSTVCTITVPSGQPNAPAQVQAVVTLAFGISNLIPHVGSAGTAYVTGDLVGIAGGTGGIAYVTASGGVVTGLDFTHSGTQVGTGYSLGTNVATTGGTGTGLTVDITGLCISATATGGGFLSMSQVGSGYGNQIAPSTSNQLIVLADPSGIGASLLAIMGNTDNALNYLAATYTSIQAAASDMNGLSSVTQGMGVVLFGGSKVVTGATNAIDMVVTLASVSGIGVGQSVQLSGFTPSAFNGGPYIITAVTLTSSPAGTITLNNASAPGSGYTSGGIVTILGNMPILNLNGYNFLANLASNSGLVQL
jgi:hypothetical protein